jgi:hypothetical protein
MSARSAGRIAAITTAKALGVPTRTAERPRSVAVPMSEGSAVPAVPQIEPGAAISTGELNGLSSLVSYVPTEALTIYIAGVAAVNLVQTPGQEGQKLAAVWVLIVIAGIANAALVWIAFRDKFTEFSRRELTVRQTRPLVAALVITELALLVFGLAVPGGIALSSLAWLPLILLVGAAILIGIARVFGLAPLRDTPPAE